jgi:hypothetical protein
MLTKQLSNLRFGKPLAGIEVPRRDRFVPITFPVCANSKCLDLPALEQHSTRFMIQQTPRGRCQFARHRNYCSLSI